MKQLLKGYLSIVALFSACVYVGTTLPNREVLVRSQSVDSARELAGWTNHINLYDMGGLYGTFAITPEYTQSFRNGRIASCIFGQAVNNAANCATDCNNNDGVSFNVTGSRVANRGTNDLLADYFGLPTDYSSVVTVKPKIQNFLVDFDLYLGLDEWLCGLWFRIHAPVVYAKWKLNLCEVASNEGTLGYDAGYFAAQAVPLANLNKSFTSFLAGNVPTLTNGVTTNGGTAAAGKPVVFEPLVRDIVPLSGNDCNNSCSSSHTTKLSDIQAALGWNFWQDEDYHVGLGIRAAAPTGTRIGSSNLLFQPVVGNGHHWELGGMFTSHYTFWRSCDYDQSFGLYVDLNVTHLFNTRQCRTFDITGAGQLSRYALAEQLTSTVIDNLHGNATAATVSGVPPTITSPGSGFTAATSQFNNVFSPVANLSTTSVKVSIPYQVDMTAMFNYTNCGFAWDLGYNLWAVGCEKIKLCSNNAIVTADTWALKGDAYVYGFENTTASPTLCGPVALSATETGTCAAPAATIYSGTNFTATNPYSIARAANPGVDNAQFAYGDTTGGATEGALFVNCITPTAAGLTNTQTRTSIQAVFLDDTRLDVNGARRKALTNKVFTNFSYTWEDCDCWIPYLGIGGFAEFGSNNCNSNCDTSCNTSCTTTTACATTTACGTSDCDNGGCRSCALSQWGIWLKGGVSFN